MAQSPLRIVKDFFIANCFSVLSGNRFNVKLGRIMFPIKVGRFKLV